jgi:Uma2 family endonuclease
MNPPHAVLVSLAEEALRAAFGPGYTTRVQLPLVFRLDTDPFPDVAVVPGRPRDYLAAHPTTAALVVEVADTTLQLDLTEKAELYATAGIRDYWVVDVNAGKLLVLRDPAAVAAGGHAYRTRLTLGPSDSVTPLAAPAAAVRVADLLP